MKEQDWKTALEKSAKFIAEAVRRFAMDLPELLPAIYCCPWRPANRRDRCGRTG